jgi:CheY-like chemotaxis protein
MYKRNPNIAEKVKKARLKIDEWRVLFAVDSGSSAQKIADFLDLSVQRVEDALVLLERDGYVSSGDAAPETAAETQNGAAVTEVEETIPASQIADEAETMQESEANLDELLTEATATETEDQSEEPFDEELPLEEETVLEEENIDDLEEIILADEEEVQSQSGGADEADNLLSAMDELTSEAEQTLTPEIAEETPAEAPVVEATQTQKPAASGGGPRVMVVDDSIVIRKMVEIALENDDFTIETAVSGKEALTKVDTFDPNIVILDILLPDVSGIEILKAIKASKGIPVIMLSGKNSPQDIELAKAQGADDFAPKPFKEEDLLAKIKALV